MQELLDFEQEKLPDREFLGWDAPLLKSVTRWLLADENLTHLASTMVVVPTSNSGRRLRMALSEGGGVLSPHVVPPSRLFEVDGTVGRQDSLWAWIHAIREVDPVDFPRLFPNQDPGSSISFAAALALARQMVKLRDTLADGDAAFRDARNKSPEKERWEELVRLETAMFQRLGKWGLPDPVRAKRDQAKSPELPPGVTRVVVACVPDPTPLAQRALQAFLAMGLPVTVLIHAPEMEKDAFDPWGVPDIGDWTTRDIDIPDWQQRLHVVDSSTEAAELSVRVLGRQETKPENTALALCDPTFEPAMDKAFTGAGWPLYNPEGKGLADSGLSALLSVWRELSGEGRPFEAVRELVRLPGAGMFLPAMVNARGNHRCTRQHAAGLMDKLHLKHLPETLADALFLSSGDAKVILESISSHMDTLESDQLSDTLRSWLSDWLGGSDPGVAEAAEPGLAEAVDAIGRLEKHDESATAREAFEMLAESVQSARVSADRSGTVLDLQGWLEISYDPAPHLILAGMHEECVPDGTVDDVFMPDTLRKDLGLRDSRGRFARDAFLLQSAISSRAGGGRVDAVVARFNDAGEARKPSRLLMRQSGDRLAAVVSHLFAESSSDTSTGGAWKRDWLVRIPDSENPYQDDPPRRISPSAIKDYLDCPFRFFLKRIVDMRIYDAGKREMDAFDFGNLCHRVLEKFGVDGDIRDSVDASDIEAYFMDALDAEMRRSYGGNLSLPLMVQLESARERLRALAPIQAADRADGWCIKATEFQVGRDDTIWKIAGHPVGMTIDRIDRHEDGNRWRVWDYKTSGKVKKPEDAHQVIWRESENRPILGDLIPARSGNGRRWAEVQLPMYAAFVQQHFITEELPEVGYINLPRAVSDVAFAPWRNFDQSVVDHAMIWAEAAVGKITAGEFKQAAIYPTSHRDWDDFAELAPDGLTDAFGL